MGIQVEFKTPSKFSGNTKLRALPLTLAAFVLILATSAGSAWSLDRFDPAGVIDGAEQSVHFSRNDANSSSSAIADKCLPLLQSIRQTTSISAMDRNQRAAGKAAALGLVFGVRFALSPTPKAGASAKPRFDVWQPANMAGQGNRAMAIAEYRACQKEEALKSSLQAIEGFRWVR